MSLASLHAIQRKIVVAQHRRFRAQVARIVTCCADPTNTSLLANGQSFSERENVPDSPQKSRRIPLLHVQPPPKRAKRNCSPSWRIDWSRARRSRHRPDQPRCMSTSTESRDAPIATSANNDDCGHDRATSRGSKILASTPSEVSEPQSAGTSTATTAGESLVKRKPPLLTRFYHFLAHQWNHVVDTAKHYWLAAAPRSTLHLLHLTLCF